MKVLRHDHITKDDEEIFFAHSIQHGKEQIAPAGGAKPWLAMVTAASDVMQITGAIVALEISGHINKLEKQKSSVCDE